ncbi:MAG: DUF2059 domain-containing protein [Verrucomicrobiota bacterium]
MVVASTSFLEIKAQDGYDKINVDKLDLINKYFKASGLEYTLRKQWEKSFQRLDDYKPEVDELKNLKEQFSLNSLTQELAPIFDKSFTSSELKSIIIFYESEAGQKLALERQSISLKLNEVANKWEMNMSNSFLKNRLEKAAENNPSLRKMIENMENKKQK